MQPYDLKMMKMAKINNIRAKTTEELKTQLAQLRISLQMENTRGGMGEKRRITLLSKNNHAAYKGRSMRIAIAQILTILRERGVGE